MPLKFKGEWRFDPPSDGKFVNRQIPGNTLQEVIDLIMRAATQGDRQEILAHFKGYFCKASGATHVWSSNANWAETDLCQYATEAAQNAPLFIEAFYDACTNFVNDDSDRYAPDVGMINGILAKHNIGYEIQPPRLVIRETVAPLVLVVERPTTLTEQAMEVFQQSLKRSEELLADGHGREAIQEILWLLESVSTAFRGLETKSGTVGGKYFNQMVKDLQKSIPGTTLERILDWLTSLHGYLSSPTGGGVRHGLDLNKGVSISDNEARLFCNLIRSYLHFLLVEHEYLHKRM